MAYVTDNTDDQTRGQALALLRTAQDVGFLLGGITLGALAQLTSISTALGFTSVGMLVICTYFAAVARETVRGLAAGLLKAKRK